MRKLCSALLILALLSSLPACGAVPQAEGRRRVSATDLPSAAPTERETSGMETETEAPIPQWEPSIPGTAVPTPVETEAPEEEGSAAGIYRLTSIVEDGAESESVAAAEALGLIYYLALSEDGSGYMDAYGEKTPLRWDGNYIYDAEDGTTSPSVYTYADGVLTMPENADNFITFQKLTAEELAAYEAKGSESVEDVLRELGLEGLFNGAEAEIPEGDPSEGSVSGTVDGNDVVILGAEDLEDKGTSALRFYYEFTNGGGVPATAYDSLYFDAAQDGTVLETVWYPEDAVPEDNYDDLYIAPGATVRCTICYACDPEGGTVALRISNLSGSDVLLYYVDPTDLSGPPEERFTLKPDQNAARRLARRYPDGDEAVQILRYAYSEDMDGGDLLRAYFSFTNQGEEPSAFYDTYTAFAFQDGYELPTALPRLSVTEDGNRYAMVGQGETVEVAVCFALRSGTPCAILLREDDTDNWFGVQAKAKS